MYVVILNGTLIDVEVPDLRTSVGWSRRDEDYPDLLTKCLFWTTARDQHGELVGFGYMTGPGLEHAYMEDIIVHPLHQRQGIGRRIVETLLSEAERRHISTLTVTYEPHNEPFYVACGFTPCSAGIRQMRST